MGGDSGTVSGLEHKNYWDALPGSSQEPGNYEVLSE